MGQYSIDFKGVKPEDASPGFSQRHLKVVELLFEAVRVVTRASIAVFSIAPAHDLSICQNGSESTITYIWPVICATDLHNILQLILDSGAATTITSIAPCHHASICQNGSCGTACKRSKGRSASGWFFESWTTKLSNMFGTFLLQWSEGPTSSHPRRSPARTK